MQIATMAAPTPVSTVITATMLLRDDVFNVEQGRRRGIVRQMTVLAPTVGPLADELAKRAIHQIFSPERLRSARAFACRMEMKSMAWA